MVSVQSSPESFGEITVMLGGEKYDGVDMHDDKAMMMYALWKTK